MKDIYEVKQYINNKILRNYLFSSRSRATKSGCEMVDPNRILNFNLPKIHYQTLKNKDHVTIINKGIKVTILKRSIF